MGKHISKKTIRDNIASAIITVTENICDRIPDAEKNSIEALTISVLVNAYNEMN